MKKIIIALSVALLSLAACTQFESETAPTFASSVAAPTIINELLSDTQNPDSTFVVTVTPGAGNAYYSFAIIKGKATALDPETLLENGYSKKAVSVKLIEEGVEVEVPLSGCFNASAQADTSVTAFDLVPNTDYTVYAVGADKNGTLSKLITLTVTTTDNIAPVVNTKKTDDSGLDDDGEISFQFDDPVELTDAFKDGTAKFHVGYAGINMGATIVPIYTKDVPVDSVAVSGNKVTIKVPDRVPGAIVFVTFDAGVVVNGTDIPNVAYTTANGAPKGTSYTANGIYGRFSTKDFKLSLPTIKDADNNDVRMPKDTVIYFKDWTTLEMSVVATDLVNYPVNGLIPMEYPEVKYTNAANRKVVYDAEDIAVPNDTTFVIALSEDPGYGTSVAFTIPEGGIEDVYGNACKEFSTSFVDADDDVFPGNFFCSYGYSLSDIIGTWNYKGTSYWAGNDEDDEWVIVASDNPAKGNVMMTKIFGFENDYNVYCDFNVHSGKFTIPDWVDFYNYVDGDDHGVLKTACNGADFVTFDFAPGTLSNPTCWFGYYGKSAVDDENLSGWWNLFKVLSVTKVVDPAPAPAPHHSAVKTGHMKAKTL